MVPCDWATSIRQLRMAPGLLPKSRHARHRVAALNAEALGMTRGHQTATSSICVAWSSGQAC